MNAKVFAAALYMGLLFFFASPTAPKIKVYGWKPMDYPIEARSTHLEGTVEIQATLKKGGSWQYQIDRYEVKSGPAVLAKAAVGHLKQQLFYCEDCKSLDGAEYDVTYEFRFDRGCLENDQCFKRSCTLRSGRVLVETSILELARNDSKQ